MSEIDFEFPVELFRDAKDHDHRRQLCHLLGKVDSQTALTSSCHFFALGRGAFRGAQSSSMSIHNFFSLDRRGPGVGISRFYGASIAGLVDVFNFIHLSIKVSDFFGNVNELSQLLEKLDEGSIDRLPSSFVVSDIPRLLTHIKVAILEHFYFEDDEISKNYFIEFIS